MADHNQRRNITYYFGAGASAPTLPIVAQFPASLVNFEKFINGAPLILEDELKNSQQDLKDFIKNLIANSEIHASVDTYAKKLFIKDDEKSRTELKKLKITLSLLFSYIQSISHVHYRYDSFFASILNRSINDLPDNIKIISWNYDSQFEIAFANFSGLPFERNQEILGVNSKYRPFDSGNKFSLFKINGTAAFHSYDEQKGRYEYDNLFKGDTNQLDIWLIRKYHDAMNKTNYHCELSFAWEDDTTPIVPKNIWDDVVNWIKATNVLIVIGYSFPVFNRVIDKLLISSMGKIDRVYFQSDEATKIRERFRSISTIADDKVFLREDLKQFLIPDELDIPEQKKHRPRII